jgi:hypothetical protein
MLMKIKIFAIFVFIVYSSFAQYGATYGKGRNRYNERWSTLSKNFQGHNQVIPNIPTTATTINFPKPKREEAINILNKSQKEKKDGFIGDVFCVGFILGCIVLLYKTFIQADGVKGAECLLGIRILSGICCGILKLICMIFG